MNAEVAPYGSVGVAMLRPGHLVFGKLGWFGLVASLGEEDRTSFPCGQ